MSQKIVEKLNNPEMIEKFNQTIADIISSDDVGGAKEIRDVLLDIFSSNSDFKKLNPTLFSIYNAYLIAVKYITLFDLKEEEIVQLIKDNFDFVLSHSDYDLERKLNYKIRDILDLEKRDVFKNKLRQSLASSGIKLGEGRLDINGTIVDATIGNWIKDYNIKVGIEKVDPLKLSEYFVKDSNLKILSKDEKIKLKRLFTLFENLKISSKEFPMFEENLLSILPNQELVVINKNQPEKINGDILKLAKEVSTIGTNIAPKIEKSNNPVFSSDFLEDNSSSDFGQIKTARSNLSPITEFEQILKNYSPSSLEYKAIKQEIDRFNKAEKKAKAKLDVKK